MVVIGYGVVIGCRSRPGFGEPLIRRASGPVKLLALQERSRGSHILQQGDQGSEA